MEYQVTEVLTLIKPVQEGVSKKDNSAWKKIEFIVTEQNQ